MTKGERIRTKRLEMGLGQTEVAERVGITKQNLYKYENNIITNIPSNIIERIASVLDCTPAFLMGWESVSNAIQTVADGVGKSVENISDGIRKSFAIYSDDELLGYLDEKENVGAEDKRLLRLLIYHFLLLSQDNREKLIERCEELVKLQGIETNGKKEDHA